jgi:hypothetical protein
MKSGGTTPGFSAEITVHQAAGRRYRGPARGQGTAPRAVPAALRIMRPDGNCVPNCVCVTQEGCPCCNYFDLAPPSTAKARAVRRGSSPR